MVGNRLVVLGDSGSVHGASGVLDVFKEGKTLVSITVDRCSYRGNSVSLTRGPVHPLADLSTISVEKHQYVVTYDIVSTFIMRGRE